jgi:hypothetical protein
MYSKEEEIKELQKIINTYSNDAKCFPMCRDLDVFIAKKYIENTQKHDGFLRVFPQDGSPYIDFYEDYGIDERLYVAFRILQSQGLHSYIDKMYFHGGTLKVSPRNKYTVALVKNEFDKILKGRIELCNDIWGYEVTDDI